MKIFILYTSKQNQKIRLPWQAVCFGLLCWLALSGCFPKTIPLASLPMDHPRAADLNLNGIDHYQAGQ
jgi:hypothetical protein